MDRQYLTDIEARVAMLLGGSDSGISTNGTYSTATSDHFNYAFGDPTVPNTPIGESFDTEGTTISPVNTKHQDSNTRLGKSVPYYKVPAEIQRVRGGDFGAPYSGPSTPRSGSVLDSYINNWAWERDASKTPTLASGSSRSDSGRSDDSTPTGTPRPAEQHRLRSHKRQAFDLERVSEDLSSPTPPPQLVERVKEGRPQRASELQRDRSTCYCPHSGCEKLAEDGTFQRLSFTRGSDWTRHYNEKHNPNALIYHCPGCTYKKTRLDKVKKHWKAKHGKDGKEFVPGKSTRVVPERLKGRNEGRWG
ncbi:hypothetical protein PRZ48_009334 [Zasmidium cellare]|uniref:C2H2-type domain-containing protein n=1 Tax=Zasmidium cellare TaxID=395010 RepID=A0ABR0EBT5_ZASCE|nr:hypothetical protein PRZ48_009334 [Zasmidium cellare]